MSRYSIIWQLLIVNLPANPSTHNFNILIVIIFTNSCENVQLKQTSKHLKFKIYHFLFNHVNLHQRACREHFTAKISINKG